MRAARRGRARRMAWRLLLFPRAARGGGGGGARGAGRRGGARGSCPGSRLVTLGCNLRVTGAVSVGRHGERRRLGVLVKRELTLWEGAGRRRPGRGRGWARARGPLPAPCQHARVGSLRRPGARRGREPLGTPAGLATNARAIANSRDAGAGALEAPGGRIKACKSLGCGVTGAALKGMGPAPIQPAGDGSWCTKMIVCRQLHTKRVSCAHPR